MPAINLFIGDSVTDCGREVEPPYGDGYVREIVRSGLLTGEIINVGISGNRLIDLEKADEVISKKLPHQKSIEDIIILSRDMIHKLLEMMMNRQDTMAYINSSPEKQFIFALILIFFGTILLLLSGLMMDK